jgi:hypothetical protein
MRESLEEIARRLCTQTDPTVKPVRFYTIYDRYFGQLADEAVAFLELGVHTGESLKVWATYFSKGIIVGLDIAENKADFSGHPNIVFERGNQTDADRLREIVLKHAPGGLDIVLDDASHVGQYAAASYATLFPYLKPGGLYVIEDWGTGYFDDWPDGNHFQRYHTEPVDDLIAKRIPSHDFGMVGFVKALVDQVAGDNVRPLLSALPTRSDTISFMHFYKEMVIIEKSRTPAPSLT